MLDPATGDVIGCVYLYPSASSDADVTAQSWVRVSHAQLDVPLADAVASWVAAEWPWEHSTAPAAEHRGPVPGSRWEPSWDIGLSRIG